MELISNILLLINVVVSTFNVTLLICMFIYLLLFFSSTLETPRRINSLIRLSESLAKMVIDPKRNVL